jgi:hypothetical protein
LRFELIETYEFSNLALIEKDRVVGFELVFSAPAVKAFSLL